ncbi:hypothetical protein [uncultured Thiodictyon sp.]|jgi:hypothetical protein|uniref:hypothetical protein n=1 Tax=uncultured Thiodictyon sp. TaxID=1846217 RepID=UPI0025ED0687|nr:hypothetical protein [uncultured Thiodictyon sp.]
MMQTPEYETKALDALTRAVAGALERKRRLGQYAVVWREDRPVCIGPDAPVECDDERRPPERAPGGVAESGRDE